MRALVLRLIVTGTLLLGACSGPASESTTTTTALPTRSSQAELSLRFDMRLEEGVTSFRTPVIGAPGERIVLLGDGTVTAPAMRLLDGNGTELAGGLADPTMTDLADLRYEFTSSHPVTLEMESTDGDRFRLRIDASRGVLTTLTDSTQANLAVDSSYLYRATGDVLVISTSAALNGTVTLEQVDGTGRFSESAVALARVPSLRWFGAPGLYRVSVAGPVGALSISSLATGLGSGMDTALACSTLRTIEREQLTVESRLRDISELIRQSMSGGQLDADWLAALQTSANTAQPAVEQLRSEYANAIETLPAYFGQDLVDVQKAIQTSWVRLFDAATASNSPREFFEQIALANDARLVRIGGEAAAALDRLDAFTNQLCGFSLRSTEIGIEA